MNLPHFKAPAVSGLSGHKKTKQQIDRLYQSTVSDLANNPDFDTVTPSWKSGVSLMPKWGQVDRAWGQIVNYVNHMGSKNPAGACPAGLLFFVYLVAGLLDHSE